MFASEDTTSMLVNTSAVRRGAEKGPFMQKPAITFAHLSEKSVNIQTGILAGTTSEANIYEDKNSGERAKAYVASALIMALNKLTCIDTNFLPTTSAQAVTFNAEISAMLHDIGFLDKKMHESKQKRQYSCQQSGKGCNSYISDVRIALCNILFAIYNVHDEDTQ